MLDAKLTLPNGESLVLPLVESSAGPGTLDISQLAKSGYYTLDPGFMSTASCTSKITYIDGEKGELCYRGYRVEEVAEIREFLDVCYLLFYGELPDATASAQYTKRVSQHTLVHEQMVHFFRGFRRDAHPMAIMVGVVGALSSFYHEGLDPHDASAREHAAIRLVAKMPTLAAMCYKYAVGQAFVYPQNHLGYSENFLHMMFSLPTEPYEVSPVIAQALDDILILHADHEQNASTSTVRLAGSTGANPFACIASGIAALWGPAHGGANEACLNMLEDIGTVENIPAYLEKAKDKNDPFRLMGFGHRVYKNYDPRAKVMSKTCHSVLDALNIHDPLLEIARKLEEIALSDPYFIEKKLYPNVDFYSGITLRAMGIPKSMFTVIFAMARTIGWISHWHEMLSENNHRIGRPRQSYQGQARREISADL